ncbi:formate dehydrogenase subunit gamma [Hydrogenivirga caldilitoris]|uniref:Formate dehydrogenase subunit gamma n=1 Tax=Hydrogenivirga caldilitoris TaxID=246264 RepID=A0A497XSM7_9AQUI|nr:formate dehydrogenase subunit gamma [Hydrogenivirga caldilitoris]RLJ71109.1 formate dehydrogenase subunit gamma [Hydrogenivirga caldilitoris]
MAVESTKVYEEQIERFSAIDRVLHWATALSFLYCLLSGIGIAYPKFHWLLTFLGGGEFARWLHPWAGVVFSIGAVLMILKWARDMVITGEDVLWLTKIKAYISGRHEELPEVGKYNAGQKLYAWIVFLSAVVFFLTGIVMWFPENFGMGLVRWSVVIHEISFIIAGAFTIIHIYMGTIGVPGTLGSMIGGKVSATWAKFHHPKWYREVKK